MTHLLLLTVLLSFLTVVWMSRQPEAQFFDRLIELPLIGPHADRLRSYYLPPTDRDQLVMGERPASSQEQLGAKSVEQRYVGIGALLRDGPERSAPVVHKTRQLDLYSVVGEQGPWIELEWGRDGKHRTLWLDSREARDLTPPLGSAPLPPGPLHARSAEPEQRSVARSELRGRVRELQRHGYEVLTDLEATDERLEGWLGLLAGIEERYRRAYGQTPVGKPAETVVLFRDEANYRRFQEQVEGLAGAVSTGHAADGIVALFAEGRSEREVGTTLVHEVTHLLNRRAVGPALPLWLEEGLAEDFAHFAGPSGAALAEYRSVNGNEVRIWGPLAGLQGIHDQGLDTVRLSNLTGFEEDLFVRTQHGFRLYTLSAFLLRHLRTSPSSALSNGLRLRHFLGSVAAGEKPTLSRLLGMDIDGLASLTPAQLEDELRRELAASFRETPGLSLQ